ncbi:MAG: ABC transporter ATP-binding protein [Spirochaetaceae bacterium]|jgi:iron complex transport system ATP-binding protein|nr:ABC transporter ATP-binding protein [Spirochaetaceae bacterium]
MKEPPILSARNLRVGYGGVPILRDLSLEVPKNRISIIIGPNACGKSTLLKTFGGFIKPVSGGVFLKGESIREIPSKNLARLLGFLPQSPMAPEGLVTADLVGRGRFPHQRFWRAWTQEDYRAVAEALETLGLLALADKKVEELSGGQRQRVWIALALAQETDILLLDEPTTFLDLAHQIAILDQLTLLNRRCGTTMVMVLHDINLAARYGDYIFALKKGALITEGPPEKAITKEIIREVFNLDCLVIPDPVYGSPLIIPKGQLKIQKEGQKGSEETPSEART